MSIIGKDRAFSCFTQATEGDFTVGKAKLDQTAESLAFNWVYMRINPNDDTVVRCTCRRLGFDYDSLLNEEVDYLARKTKEAIRNYECT